MLLRTISRTNLLYLVLGVLIGYFVTPKKYIVEYVPQQAEPPRCPACPMCPTWVCPVDSNTTVSKNDNTCEWHDGAVNEVNWVPDHFDVKTAEHITVEPTPGNDNTNVIPYPDKYVHNYRPLQSKSKAQKEGVWLVVYIASAVGFDRRQNRNPMVWKSIRSKGQPSARRAVVRSNFRKSWLYRNGQAKLWFVLSSQSPLLKDPKFRIALDKEQSEFRDLLFVDCPDVDNDYNPPSGTTIKMGYALQHAQVNYNYNYFARSSDDVHFNVDQLYRLVVVHKAVPRTRLFMGKRWVNMVTRTDDHQRRFGSYYPAYPQGLGYIFSADVAQRLGRMVQMGVPFLSDWPEDVIVATWVTGWGLNIVDSLRWFHNKRGRGGPEFPCVADALMTHELSPADMHKVDDSGVWRCDGGVLPKSFWYVSKKKL